MTMETMERPKRGFGDRLSDGFFGFLARSGAMLEAMLKKVGGGLLVVYAALVRVTIFWIERTRLHAVRVMVKTAWLLLTFWILVFALFPLEVESWKLWMSNKELATNLAIAVVATTFLVLAVAKFAWDANKKPIAVGAYVLAVLVTFLAITSGWNYLLHEQEAMRGGGEADAKRSADALKQAEEDLARFDVATAASSASLNEKLKGANSEWAPTGTSRLVTSVAEYETQARKDRRELAKKVEEARAQAVVAHTDPRPIDIVIGNMWPFNGNTNLAAVVLDLVRVVFFKLFVLFGLSLAFTSAPESAKKEEAAKRKAEAARAMQGADGKFKPRKQAGLPQADTDNNSDWIAPEARVKEPKKPKSTKKGKRWLDDVFSKKAAENAQVEDAQFTEEPVELRASEFDGLTEDGQNPQSEVSDVEAQTLQVEPAGQGTAESIEPSSSSREFEGVLDGFAEPNLGVLGQQTEEDGELSHAQEDQQAEPELQSEEELRSLDVAAEVGEGGFDRDESGLELLHDSEAGLADDGSETRLPDGEGVVVWDDETDPTIKELLRKTEAAE